MHGAVSKADAVVEVYTSIKLTTRLLRAGIQASICSVGDSYNNALAQDLWMLIKTECIRGSIFATRAEANLALFEYIDGFYSSRRIKTPRLPQPHRVRGETPTSTKQRPNQ